MEVVIWRRIWRLSCCKTAITNNGFYGVQGGFSGLLRDEMAGVCGPGLASG